MIDVHPPEHTPHSWKDFFIHIATIVVGLLIAIGLEQSVEWVHRQHERHVLREELQKEHAENRSIYQSNVASYRLDRAILLNNLRIFKYLQQHPGTPEEKLSGVPYWGYGYTPAVSAAYVNAQQTQTLGLLPQQEAESLANFYNLLKKSEDASYSAAINCFNAGDFAAIDPDPSHLTPVQVQAEIENLLRAFSLNRETAIWLWHLHDAAPDFPPGPTIEEIQESSGWVRSPKDNAALAAGSAITHKAFAPFQAAVDAAEQDAQKPDHQP